MRLAGTKTEKYVDQNLAALDVKLTPEDIKHLEEIADQVHPSSLHCHLKLLGFNVHLSAVALGRAARAAASLAMKDTASCFIALHAA